MREKTLEAERDFLKLSGDISATQLQILLVFGDKGVCTMNQLANIVHFSKANITQMIDR